MTETNNSNNAAHADHTQGRPPLASDGRDETKVRKRPKDSLESSAKNIIDDAKDASGAVGKTVVAAALAGAVATGAAAVTPDQINLPEPTPIVQIIDQGTDEPDQVVDDQESKKESAWKNIWKILKYALLALFFATAFILAAMQGCAACVGPIAVPVQSSAASSQ